jgi:hypothetical protein
MMPTFRLAILSGLVFSGILRAEPSAVVDTQTLHQKALMGYQGWFSCPKDGSEVNRWHHWLRSNSKPPKLVVEMWPDIREFDRDELFDTPWQLPDGSPARLFSSYQEKTVLRHFKWMREAGIDGVLLQRFIGEVQDPAFFKFRNEVTRHVIKGAAQQGRTFALEYDMAADQAAQIIEDWKYLVDQLKLTESPRYLCHRGKPVLGLWGLGFTHRTGDAKQAQQLVDWFRTEAPERYRATIVGGVPCGWRVGTGDSRAGDDWAKLYRSLDVISPWTVGRYIDDASADRHLREFLIPDLEETQRLGIDYLPVVFPGFAWKNLHQGPENQIPRRGGRFYWRQVHNAVTAGAVMLKTAMFDEVDEATAMFKVAPKAAFAPVGVYTLTLDANGETLPSDWYLRLGGEAGKLLRKEIPRSPELPLRP